MLAWVRRQFAYTLDDTAPSLNGLITPTEPSGLIVPTELAAPAAAAIGPETPGATGIFDLTAIYNAFVYQPLNGLVQFWITSPLGELVNGVINTIFGRGEMLIGNGADGTALSPDGEDGGLLFGNGGDGFDGVSIGVAGGNGGDAGWWGDGGDGGAGFAGLDGGDGGDAGDLAGIGGNGGDGGAAVGPAAPAAVTAVTVATHPAGCSASAVTAAAAATASPVPTD